MTAIIVTVCKVKACRMALAEVKEGFCLWVDDNGGMKMFQMTPAQTENKDDVGGYNEHWAGKYLMGHIFIFKLHFEKKKKINLFYINLNYNLLS